MTEKTETPEKTPEQVEADKRYADLSSRARDVEILSWILLGVLIVAIVSGYAPLMVGCWVGFLLCMITGYGLRLMKAKVRR